MAWFSYYVAARPVHRVSHAAALRSDRKVKVLEMLRYNPDAGDARSFSHTRLAEGSQNAPEREQYSKNIASCASWQSISAMPSAGIRRS